MSSDSRPLLRRAAELAADFLAGLDARPVGVPVAVEAMRERLGGPLPEEGEPAAVVLEKLVRDGDPGIVATAGRR